MTTLFVTGSGTDVGKTHVSCRLIEALPKDLELRVVKPVVTGLAPEVQWSDPGRLLRAQGRPITAEAVAATSPWRFDAAISADMAAAREQRRIPFDELLAFSRAPDGVELNLVEVIGGVMSPLDDSHTVLDWIAALDAPAVLVVGSYLGSLSHALTAASALAGRGVEILALVVSASVQEPVPTSETAASLARLLPRIVPGTISEEIVPGTISGTISGTPVLVLPRDEKGSAAELAALVMRRIEAS